MDASLASMSAPGPGGGRIERLAVAAYVALVVGASALPNYIAWRNTPQDRVYTGASGSVGDDFATYLARMRAGARGEWTYRSPYAPEVERTLTIRPFYGALGFLTGMTGAPLWVGYQAARLALGAISLLLLFALAASLSRSPLERWAAFVLSTAGSGIGWMLGRGDDIGSWSYDLWVSELNAAFSLLTNPHFPLSIILMLACLAGVARAVDRAGSGGPAWWSAAGAAIPFAFLALDHAYDTVVLSGVIAAYGAAALLAGRPARRHLLGIGVVFAAIALPAVAWTALGVLLDPSLAHMGLAQPIGSPWILAAGLGILPIFAAVGGPTLARRSTMGRILVAWCLVVPLLVALPITFPRRMVMAWHVPLGMAAGVGLARLLEPVRRQALRAVLAGAVLLFASLTTVDVFTHTIRSASDSEMGYRTWLPREFIEVYAWLQSHAAPRSVVLGRYVFSNFLPVYTDLCPYFGHWAETPDGRERRARVLKFYDTDTTDAWRSQFASDAGIDWVVAPQAGLPSESAHLDQRAIKGLFPAGRVGFVDIFRVDRGTAR